MDDESRNICSHYNQARRRTCVKVSAFLTLKSTAVESHVNKKFNFKKFYRVGIAAPLHLQSHIDTYYPLVSAERLGAPSMRITGVSLVYHWCITGVLLVYHRCITGVSQVYQTYITSLSKVFHRCIKRVSQVYQMCIIGISNVFHRCIKRVTRVHQMCIIGISNVFHRCIKRVTRVHICLPRASKPSVCIASWNLGGHLK